MFRLFSGRGTFEQEQRPTASSLVLLSLHTPCLLCLLGLSPSVYVSALSLSLCRSLSLSLSLFLFVLVGRTGWKRERGLRAWGRALPLRHCHFHWATRNLTPFSSRCSGQNLESRAM